ncbi:helix-turn-helix transcriptional regulator [Pseudomonas sp. PDM23]|uniref:helix-turn-helix domain-containing protein n=1 Tax=Pseudomonas sp. PDM23 TaxID=2769275 RepID=UPI001782189F|nr:helix-turn-helix transcriptional regulator [Pseudomonas sp. PDM23]MBD9574804.1 helix-turn-helix transcriptional regulator [Pseudomonas sp. PDM23]
MLDEEVDRLALLTGQAIAKQRKRVGMTQEKVAELLGLGNEAVSRIERGLVRPNLERLIQFSAIFECDLAELLTESSPRAVDQANRLHDLLAPLAIEDRELLIDTVERLAKRLSPPPTPPKKKR